MGWLVPCLPSQSRVRPRGVARYYLRCRFLVEGRCPVSDAAFAATDLSPGRLARCSRSSGGASTVGWSRRPGSFARRPLAYRNYHPPYPGKRQLPIYLVIHDVCAGRWAANFLQDFLGNSVPSGRSEDVCLRRFTLAQ